MDNGCVLGYAVPPHPPFSDVFPRIYEAARVQDATRLTDPQLQVVSDHRVTLVINMLKVIGQRIVYVWYAHGTRGRPCLTEL